HDAWYWLTHGNIALALRRYRDARESFSRAIEIDPGYAEAHYRHGLAFHSEFRHAEAVAAYREALRFAPDVAEVHWQLAEALAAAERLGEAMVAYQEAFRRDVQGRLDRRGCLDVLTRLRFLALPEFWNAELNRIFARKDIDKALYVRAGLN